MALDLIEILTLNPKETKKMKFLMTISADPTLAEPPESLYVEMGEYIQKQIEAGYVIDTGGLAPVEATTTVRLKDGEITVTDGPFAEAKEVVGGYALMEYATLEAAIEGAKEFLDLHRRHIPDYKCQTEIRQVFGPDDE